MKKTISILLAVLMLVGCMSIGFSASAASNKLTIYTGIQLTKIDDYHLGILAFPYEVSFIQNRGLSNQADVTAQFRNNNDPYLFSHNFQLKPLGGSDIPYSTYADKDDFYSMQSNTNFYMVLPTAVNYASVEVIFYMTDFDTFVTVPATKQGSNDWYFTFHKGDFVPKPVTRLDVDIFDAQPVIGQTVGTDYYIYASATANDEPRYGESLVLSPAGRAAASSLGNTNGQNMSNTYVCIQKGNDIIYPKSSPINYSQYFEAEESNYDGTIPAADGAKYEAGQTYSYYAAFSVNRSYKFTADTEVYVNGEYYGTADGANIFSDNLVAFCVQTTTMPKIVNAINIDFSADPQEGAKVGSDYTIKITPNTNATLKTNGEPLVNYPAQPEGFYGYTKYQPSYVAIYESNNLLYPGYSFIKWNSAPVESSDPSGANGTPPAQDNGNTVISSTPSNYAKDKTYKYYAIFQIDDTRYSFDSNTVFNVNGVKATDVTLSSDGKAAQVFLDEMTVIHKHSLIHFPRVDATTDAEGNVDYYHCEGCGKNFSDAAGTQQLSNIKIDKLPTPTNPDQGGNNKTGSCKYCGEDHPGFGGFFVKIIHSILALFGLRKK